MDCADRLHSAADLERAWLHPAATAATRKRILRAALSEVIARRDSAIIHAVLHWQGGDHTELHVAQRELLGMLGPRRYAHFWSSNFKLRDLKLRLQSLNHFKLPV